MTARSMVQRDSVAPPDPKISNPLQRRDPKSSGLRMLQPNICPLVDGHSMEPEQARDRDLSICSAPSCLRNLDQVCDTALGGDEGLRQRERKLRLSRPDCDAECLSLSTKRMSLSRYHAKLFTHFHRGTRYLRRPRK